jgi:very-short-patch-repair endonuclease
MPVPLIRETVASLGGIATTSELLRRGVSADRLRRAAQRGEIVRPRRGVVALPSLPRALRRAAATGGPLAGLSAASYYGYWTPTHDDLHISVRKDSLLRPRIGIVLHHDAHLLSSSERFLVTRNSCLRQCIRILPFDHAVAVLDSALHAGRVGDAPSIDLERLRDQLPRRLHVVLRATNARSEAGAESIARIRLGDVGVIARPQVWITHDIRVDLLVGDDLAIEIGSKEFHALPERYELDHQRSAILLGLGLDVLEFTTLQVTDDWPTVEAVVLSRVAPLRVLDQRFGTPRRM